MSSPSASPGVDQPIVGSRRKNALSCGLANLHVCGECMSECVSAEKVTAVLSSAPLSCRTMNEHYEWTHLNPDTMLVPLLLLQHTSAACASFCLLLLLSFPSSPPLSLSLSSSPLLSLLPSIVLVHLLHSSSLLLLILSLPLTESSDFS